MANPFIQEYDEANFRGTGPAFSNALIPPPTTAAPTSSWEHPGLDRGGPPMGGQNTSSMLAGGMKKASAYISANRNNIGYALGKAAQAVMGPRQDTPAAQLGGLGAQLNQQQALKSTTAKMLAGMDLAEIPEASILAPEQVAQITTQASDVKKTRHAMEMDRLKYELELKKAGLDEKEITSRMAYYDAQTGYTKRQTEVMETPAEQRAGEEKSDLAKIAAQGEEERKNIAARGGEERSNIKARSEAEVATAKNLLTTKYDFAKENGVTPEEIIELMIKGETDVTDPVKVNDWIKGYNSVAKSYGREPLKEIEPIWTWDPKSKKFIDQFGNTKPVFGAPKG